MGVRRYNVCKGTRAASNTGRKPHAGESRPTGRAHCSYIGQFKAWGWSARVHIVAKKKPLQHSSTGFGGVLRRADWTTQSCRSWKVVCFKSTRYGGHDKARNEECMQVVRVLSLMHCMPCWGILQGGTVRSVIKIPLWQLWVVTATGSEVRLPEKHICQARCLQQGCWR